MRNLNNKPLVGIVMGSDSDYGIMKEAAVSLEELNIGYEMTITSAHRSPTRTIRYARGAEKKGLEIIIAGAGAAAHLAGVIASETVLPVIGVPIASSPLGGIDSLLSTVQMPGGVPVATMGLGSSGARNAAILAAQILGIKYPRIRESLRKLKKDMARKVSEKARKMGEKRLK